MRVTTALHDLMSRDSDLWPHGLDYMRARVFCTANRPLFAAMLDDFQRLYYDICPQTGMDRGELLDTPRLYPESIPAGYVLAYIAENCGYYELRDDILYDLDPAPYDLHRRRLPINASSIADVRRFYAATFRASGRITGLIENRLRHFIADRIEVLCHKAGEALADVSISDQFFLISNKDWGTAAACKRKTFLSAAGNMAMTLPVGSAERRLIKTCVNKLEHYLLEASGADDDYTDFLTSQNFRDRAYEREVRLAFMRQHFGLLSQLMGVPYIKSVSCRKDKSDGSYYAGSITYTTLANRGINAYSRADVFNIGNHEYGHHLARVVSSLPEFHQENDMHARIAFNNAVYFQPKNDWRGYNVYNEQYIERFCDALAGAIRDMLIRRLHIHPRALSGQWQFTAARENGLLRMCEDEPCVQPRRQTDIPATIAAKRRRKTPRIT